MDNNKNLHERISDKMSLINKRYEALDAVIHNPELFPLSFLEKAIDNWAISLEEGYKIVADDRPVYSKEDEVVSIILDDPSIRHMFIALRVSIINLERTGKLSKSNIKEFVDILL